MEKKSKKDASLVWKTLGLLGHLGFLIAVPLVIFGLLGRFLDKRFDTSPWLLLTGLFISLIISSIAVMIKTLQIVKEMEQLGKKEEGEQVAESAPQLEEKE